MIMNVLGIEPAAVCLGDIAFAMWIRGALWEYRVHGKNLLVFSDVAALSSLLPNFMFAYIFVRDARRRLGLDVSFRCDPPRWRSYLHLSLKIFKIGGMSVWMIVFALWQKRLLQDLYVAYCTQLSRNIIFTLPKTRGKLEKEMAMHASISSPFIWRNFDKVKFITTLWDRPRLPSCAIMCCWGITASGADGGIMRYGMYMAASGGGAGGQIIAISSRPPGITILHPMESLKNPMFFKHFSTDLPGA